MTFPALYTVTWYAFDPDGAEDELGNDEPAWLPGEDRKVIGWRPTLTEETGQFEAREITNGRLQVPPGFTYTVQDRMQLPGSTDLYEVAGVETGGLAFHGWNPGDVLDMRLVKD